MSANLDPHPKWYVYIDAIKNHEGPLAAQEVGERLTQRKITPQSFVWAEGMADWKPLSEVSELEPILRSFQPLPAQEVASALNRVPVVSAEPEAKTQITTTPDPTIEEPVVKEKTRTVSIVGGVEPTTAVSNKRRTSWRRIVMFLVMGAVFGYGVIGYLSGQFDPMLEHPAVKEVTASVSEKLSGPVYDFVSRTPALQWAKAFISPIEKLVDVSEEDYELLAAAAAAPIAGGIKAAVAISNDIETLATPVIYVASNAPKDTRFQVTLTGKPETLLGYLEFSKTEFVSIDKRLGKTIPIRGPDGKAIPAGEYKIEVTLAPGQEATVKGDPTKPLAKAYSFLGGLKNEAYTQKLNEFHKKVTEQAAKELADAKQFSATIENQLRASTQEFEKQRKQRNAKLAKAAWAKFSGSWTQLTNSLKEQFAKWNPATLKTDFFYGSLFERFAPALESVEKVHQSASSYFDAPKPPAAFDASRAPLVNQAHEQLSAIKGQIAEIEKQPKSADGLPRKLK